MLGLELKWELELELELELEVELELELELEVGVLLDVGGATEEEGGGVEDDGSAGGELGSGSGLGLGLGSGLLGGGPPLPPASYTTILAVLPLGAVTTQKLAPPAPLFWPPVTSFTPFLAGLISQGRPLQFPSHSILTPNEGTSSRKGVAGSR